MAGKGRCFNSVAWAGLIYLCYEADRMEFFKYRVLAVTEKEKYIMDMITTGMYIFFYDIDLKLLYGIYAASSSVAFMLEPRASFGGCRPWQVKFHIEKHCLPLHKDVFKASIKDNCIAALNAEQVHKLVSLFNQLPGGPVQHPSTNASNQCIASCNNAASFAETGLHIQDQHLERYFPPRLAYEANQAAGLIQSNPLPKPSHTPTQPFTGTIMPVSYMHGLHQPGAKHGFLSPPPCEGEDSDEFIQIFEPAHRPDDAVATENFKHCYHAPQAKHGSLPPTLTSEANKVDEFTPPPRLYYEPNKVCMHCYHEPTAKNGFIPPKLTCEADTSIQSAPLPRLNQEHMHPLNGVIITKKHRHDHHAPMANHGFLPPMSAFEANKADGIIRSAPLLQLNQKRMHPFDKPAKIEKCMHDYHAPTGKHGCTLTCEANKADEFMCGAHSILDCELMYPVNDAGMTNELMHSYHAPTAKHGFLPSASTCEAHKADRFLQNDPHPRLNEEPTYPSIDARRTEKCAHGYHAPQANKPDGLIQGGSSPIHRHYHAGPLSGPSCALCVTSELQNTEPNLIRTGDLGNLDFCVNSSVVRKGYLMPNVIHGIFLESKLYEGKSLGVSCSLCSDLKIAPGAFNALQGHATENLHKRALQDTYTYAPSDAAQSVLDTNGEIPLKCMHYEVRDGPIDDPFAGAVDGVP